MYCIVQPNNLLRALHQIREAAALGLVEGPDEWENCKEKSLAKRIQSFSRFLLEQVFQMSWKFLVNDNAPAAFTKIYFSCSCSIDYLAACARINTYLQQKPGNIGDIQC